MTINFRTFEEQEMAVLSAGTENLVRIKRGLLERLQNIKIQAKSCEDPTLPYDLYLDALCDIRLGACRWNSPVAGESRLVALMAAELDFFAEWYEVVSTVARSINQRQKDGRRGCNTAKKEALVRFVADHAEEIDRLVRVGKRYAVYLNERTGQIMRMINFNVFGTVEKINTLRSAYL